MTIIYLYAYREEYYDECDNTKVRIYGVYKVAYLKRTGIEIKDEDLEEK